jgi:hypothetical protein
VSDLAALILAIGAILTGVGGIVTAYAAVVRSRREAETECEKQLAELRNESEHEARALHWWRMQHLDEREPDDL